MISGGLGFISKDAKVQQHQEKVKRHTDMRADLRENYGVTTVKPVGGKTLDGVYSDVKGQGSLVKDQMQETTERNTKRTKENSREWMRSALPRTKKRYKEKMEKKRKEDAAQRRITLT